MEFDSKAKAGVFDAMYSYSLYRLDLTWSRAAELAHLANETARRTAFFGKPEESRTILHSMAQRTYLERF